MDAAMPEEERKIEKPTYRGVAHLHVCIFLNLGDVDDVGDDDDDGDDDVGDVKVEAGIASRGKTRKLSGKAFVGDLRQKMGVRVLQNQGFLQDSSTTDSYFSSILLTLFDPNYFSLPYFSLSTLFYYSILLYSALLSSTLRKCKRTVLYSTLYSSALRDLFLRCAILLYSTYFFYADSALYPLL
jgi:hypothetical protein